VFDGTAYQLLKLADTGVAISSLAVTLVYQFFDASDDHPGRFENTSFGHSIQ